MSYVAAARYIRVCCNVIIHIDNDSIVIMEQMSLRVECLQTQDHDDEVPLGLHALRIALAYYYL